MTWLLIAILAQIVLGTSAVFDKFLINRRFFSFVNRFMAFFGAMPMTAYATDTFHYHVYNQRRLQDLIKKEGFKILKAASSYLPFNFPAKILGVGKFFAILGDIFPTMGNQLIVFAKKG